MAMIGLVAVLAVIAVGVVLGALAIGGGAARLVALLVTLLGALICGYLFLAGFEYPGVTRHKIVTGSLGVLFLVASVWLALRKPPR